MTRHLLVTNDFPPKIGGIQNYLWELWRRLPADDFVVYTTPYRQMAEFDAQQGFRIERSPEPVLGPYPWLVRRINRLAHGFGAELVLLDPAVPLGAIGPYLDYPYGVVLHGAEVTIPGRLPGIRSVLARVLRKASLVVSAGAYALSEAERCAQRSLPAVVVPPGVDINRFHPYSSGQREAARQRLGVGEQDFLVATVNRLVPRKGMDTLVRAAAIAGVELARRQASRRLVVRIGGSGRHEPVLRQLVAQTGAPAELLGRIDDEAVADLYGAADAMAMLCYDRWFGLEQEGFGIAFLEAAAAGVPQVAGRSGGAHEAVIDEVTGQILSDPRDHQALADILVGWSENPTLVTRLGEAARKRAETEFSYEVLAARLQQALADWGDASGASPGTRR